MSAALKIYRGEEEGRSPLSLRVAFLTHKAPEIEGRRSPSTLRAYRTAIAHWEEFCSQRASTISTRAPQSPASERIVSPVDDVYRIDDTDLDQFARWLRSHRPGGAGLSVDSIDKTWKVIRSILRKLGPRETGNPRGIGLLDRIPVMDSLADLDGFGSDDVSEGATDISLEQLGKLWEACAVAQWPRSSTVPPAIQWRGWIVLASVLGIRVENLNQARREWWILDPRSPAAGSDRRHPWGWLCFVPEKTKRSKRARLIIPLPRCVRRHVDALIVGDRERLFDFGARGNRSAWETWQAITAEAGLAHLKRCDLRDAANQVWGAINRDLGRWVCGHAARDVNERHYTRIEPDLLAAIPQLQLPAEFDRDPSGVNQQFLF